MTIMRGSGKVHDPLAWRAGLGTKLPPGTAMTPYSLDMRAYRKPICTRNLWVLTSIVPSAAWSLNVDSGVLSTAGVAANTYSLTMVCTRTHPSEAINRTYTVKIT